MYTHLDDHPDLELMHELVTVNVKHVFTATEIDQEGQLLANAVNDKQKQENEKKVAMAAYKNKIDTFEGSIKLHASNLTHGFTFVDKAAVMYRDYARAKRVYFDKGNGNFIKEEDFHESDFQKKLTFENEEKELQERDRQMQQQIEENNQTGDFAEGKMGYDKNGNLTDIVDNIIVDKKMGIVPADDDLPEDDIFKDEN